MLRSSTKVPPLFRLDSMWTIHELTCIWYSCASLRRKTKTSCIWKQYFDIKLETWRSYANKLNSESKGLGSNPNWVIVLWSQEWHLTLSAAISSQEKINTSKLSRNMTKSRVLWAHSEGVTILIQHSNVCTCGNFVRTKSRAFMVYVPSFLTRVVNNQTNP